MDRFIKQGIVGLFFIVVVINLVMSCVLLSWIDDDKKNLKAFQATISNVQSDIQDLKVQVDKEIQLREDLFPKLKKSASLLKKYNPRLDPYTAVAYAFKINECSDDEVTLNILTALICVESSANYKAVSNKGALGLTQVMPKIWNCDRKTLIDPYKNIEIGSSILKYYIKRHGLEGGLSAYNSGRKNRSLPYARKVITIANRYF
ncbi:MAG: lytic transglycosylase domain-containing protein [Deltaproteobacteria bacterium]|nr:lytic transglycosylase domain-containing protein [Deltaproteobacteria bacterium]